MNVQPLAIMFGVRFLEMCCNNQKKEEEYCSKHVYRGNGFKLITEKVGIQNICYFLNWRW
jgi:hypothetical protein